MFGQQKTDVDKKISSLSDEILDLKNQKKLAELDFEKRVLLLEDAVSTINKTVGSAKNLKEMKENLAHILNVQEKLREIEDRQLIDRLEVMQSADALGALEGSVGTISRKLDLLSDAVKILGGRTKEGHAALVKEKIDAGQKDAESLKAEIAALRAEKADLGAIQALSAKCSSLESAMRELDKNFADLASSARETLKKRDSDLAVVQKKISELEVLPIKAEKLAASVDSLAAVDKKIEAALSSLRNQIAAQEARIAPIDSLQKAGKLASSDIRQVKSDLEAAKRGFEDALKRAASEQAKTAAAEKATAKGEIRKIQDAYFAVESDYGRMKQALEELNSTLEKRVERSAEDVLKREARLHEESLAALRDSRKRLDALREETNGVLAKVGADYEKICSMFGEKHAADFIKRVEEIKKIEAGIKKDIYAEITAKTEKLVEVERGRVATLAKNYETLERALPGKVREIVGEELHDVTLNLKRISDVAQKKDIKPEDIEHIVESKLATVAADYNKLAKALGTLQRVVKEEYISLAKSMHDKIESDMKPVIDEIADLREDIEQAKNLRSDLVDDVNRLIAGYEDKNKIREVQKLENAEDYEAGRMDALEDSFNKKLVELMHRMDGEFKEAMEERASAGAGMDDKFSMLERENQALRADLEELKKAYFQIMKLQQSAPIIIE